MQTEFIIPGLLSRRYRCIQISEAPLRIIVFLNSLLRCRCRARILSLVSDADLQECGLIPGVFVDAPVLLLGCAHGATGRRLLSHHSMVLPLLRWTTQRNNVMGCLVGSCSVSLVPLHSVALSLSVPTLAEVLFSMVVVLVSGVGEGRWLIPAMRIFRLRKVSSQD